MRRTLPRWVVAAAVIVLAGPAPLRADVSGLAIRVGANFYAPEVWEPGKVRRWMSQDGVVFLTNTTARSLAVSLRFYAEAFQIRRDLIITLDGRPLAQWPIEPVAQRYIVVKPLTLDPGEHRMLFRSLQPPRVPAQVGKSPDHRRLSVAFGPFTAISAGSPEAQQEWTGAFAAAPASSKLFTRLENEAHTYRREGRFLEATRAYERALAAGASDYSHLLYGLSLMVLDRRREAERVLEVCVSLRGSGPRQAWVRGLCQKVLTYLGESEILAAPERDPARRARTTGRIYEALQTYERTLANEPGALQASYWLGVLNAVAERRTQARPHLERVIALSGESADGRFLKSLRAYF